MAKKKKNYNLLLYELQQEAVRNAAITGGKVSNSALEKQAQDEYLAPIRDVNLGRKAAEATERKKKQEIITQAKKNTKKSTIKEDDIVVKNKKYFNDPVEKKWYQQILEKPDVFDDGYQIGDISKTIGGSILDLGIDAVNGAIGLGEGLGQLGGYGIAQIADWTGNDDYANNLRQTIADNPSPITKHFREWQEDSLGEYSIFGDTADAGIEGIGQMLALGGIGKAAGAVAGGLAKGTSAADKAAKVAKATEIARNTAMFTSVAGHSLADSYQNEDIEDWQAWTRAIGSGYLAQKIEALGGIFSKGGADKAATEAITQNMKSSFAKIATRWLGTGIAEGGEEGLENIAGKVLDKGIDEINKLTSKNDVTLYEKMDWNEFWTDVFAGAMAGTSMGAGQTFIEASNVKSQNPNMTFKEVINEVDRQQSNQVQAQAQGLQQEIAKKTEELNQSQDVREKQIIQETINGLNEELNELTNAQQITDEKELRKQRFTTKETEVSDNQDINDFYKSIEDANRNDTKTTHDFAAFVSNIMKDKGIKARAVNHDILIKEGKIYKDTDGQYKFIDKNGVKTDQVANINAFKENGTLNINMDSSSSKVVESIVGHEIGEFIKASDKTAYNEIKEIAIKLGEADGTYNKETLNRYGETYQDLTDDVTDEYVNDKLGELFTNENFVNELSKKPNLLQRIISEVKHLVKMATAGSAEARQLLSLQHKLEKKFKEVYRNTDLTKQTNTATKYSIQGLESYTDDEIKTFTNDYIQEKLEENGIYDVTIKDTAIHGSRGRGTARVDSDLDVVVEFEGDIREDDLFNILNEEPMYIDGIQVDINPITEPLNDYMERSKAYDEEILSKNKTKYSLDTDGKMVDNKGNEVKLEATEAGTHGTLMAIHNFNSSITKGVLELGGFPSPSIAVTNPKIVNHEQFGDVSVLFNKSTIDPANRQNEVYDRDVWSPDFPSIEYGVDTDILWDISDKIYRDYKDSIAGVAHNRYLDQSNLEDLLNRAGTDATLNNIKSSEEMQYVYQRTVDKNFKPVMKEKRISNYVPNETLKRFLEEYKGKPVFELSNQEIEALGEQIAALEAQIEIESKPEIYKDEKLRKSVIDVYRNIYVDNFSKTDLFIYDVQKYQRELERNNGNVSMDIDRKATLEKVKQEINKEEYNKWVDDTFNEVINNAKRGIRNDKDPYTPSGNRRKFSQLHDDVTLENIVKAMTKQKTQAGQKTLLEGGFGKISASTAQRFKSIADIKKNESKIVTAEEAKVLTEPISEKLKEDMQELDQYYNSHGSIFGGFEAVNGAVMDLAGKKNWTINTFKDVLKDYYNFDIDNIPNEVLQKIIDDLKEIQKLPTDYFEAKPQRAVRLDEAEAFVVPNDMDADLKQQLRDRGINVIDYDPNIEGDRQAKINQFDNLKFSLSAENEIAPTGQQGTHFEDMRLEIEEAIAPLQETIANLTEQVKTMQESFAPTSQDIVEKQGQEAFNHITDEQVPTVDVNNMSWEDAIDSIMDSGDFEYSNTEHIPSPLEDRDIYEVRKDRKTKAYQYEHPEYKPFFQAEAQMMLYDLDNTIKGERGVAIDELGNTKYYGITRQTTDAISYLKDDQKYSYAEIRKGLNAIIEDDGKENIGVAKSIEFLLDERLREGYTTSDGIPIPPNQDYINFLNEKQMAEHNKEAFNAITDEDIPMYEKIEPLQSPTTKENTASQQTTSIKAKTAQKGNTDATEAKQRSWAETSTKSDSIKGKILLSDLDAEKIQYVPVTNKETLSKANAKLDSLGYDKALDQFYSIIKSGEMPKLVDITMGQRLMQEALAKGDKATAIEILQDITMLGTEVGQITQSLSIIQRMTPAGQLRMLDKTVQRGKLRGEKAFEGVKLTEDMMNRIMECYNKDGVTYDQDKLNATIEQIKQELADQMKVTFMEKVNAWRYLSMLGNPKTHDRNIISNVASLVATQAKNALARTIEGGTNQTINAINKTFNTDIAPIERTKTWKPASQEIKDFSKQTTLEMKDIILGENQIGIKAEIKAKRKIFKGFLEKISNGNSDIMTKEDWWFSRFAFKNSLQEFLTANGIETQQDIQNNPKLVEKGKQYALEQAQIATFRQYSWLASQINNFERKNAATQIAVGAVLPFKKTPINIAKAGLNYSPLGFAKTLAYDIPQVVKHKQTNGKEGMEASQLIDNIAKHTTGSALTLVGYMLAQMGFLNGAGEDDKEGKYDYQLGKQGYSINIDGSTYSLSWLSPIAMPLLVGANAFEQLVNKEEWNPDVVIQTLGQTLDPLSEMSFLSSFVDVLSSYEQGDIRKFFSMFEAAGKNYTTQFIPTLLSQIAGTLDDTKRTTKVSGDSTFKMGEELYNQIIYKIPGLRETLEPSTDIWGNEIKQNEKLFTRAFENFIAPYARKDSIATEIDEELKDLYGQTGDTGLLPSIPSNYVKYDGERYDMSAEEYTDYKKMYGQTANDLLEDLFRTTTYQRATSEERADMVNDVYDYARDEAKLDYLAKEGVDYTNATEDKVEVYKENLIKGAVENDMTTKEYGLYLDDPEEYKFLMEKGYEYRRQYFDTYDSLKEIDESFETQKEGINDDDELDALYNDKRAGIVDKIINSGLEDTEKASLYKRYYNSDTVDTVMKSAINIDDYLIYTTKEFKADKNEKGNSIPGSRKEKVEDYVFSIDGLNTAQKAILIKSTNTFKYNDYNVEIVRYLDDLQLPYDDFVSILKDLDMTVKGDTVYWD